MGTALRPVSTVHDDRGMTLAEVLVAMFIFALVSTGMIYTTLSILSVTRDARARQVAANLAAEEIDLVRDTGDLFALLDAERSAVLNGDTFHVARETRWVSDPALDFECGTGGGELRYKRVNVTVTWDNMRAGTEPVRSDTVIQPKDHINDPSKGTIVVSVLGASGTGAAGVAVSATPSSTPLGAQPVSGTILPTDSQGCTYILKVTPGNYDVTVSRSGYVDQAQAATSTRTVGVAQGTSAAVQFQYDRAATFQVAYAATYAPAPGEVLRVSATPVTTFANTYGSFAPSTTTSTALSRSFALHPFTAGYSVYAGSCAAADPEAWAPGTDETGAEITGTRLPAVAAEPGDSVSVGVPTGVVQLHLGSGSNRRLKAVSATGPADDPGCASSQVLDFGSSSGYVLPTNGEVTVALPYGSWRLYYGTSGSNPTYWTTPVTAGQLSLPAPAVPARSTIAEDGTVTFDPRTATP